VTIAAVIGLGTMGPGIAATLAKPEWSLQHADALVLGEAEETWPQVIADFEAGRHLTPDELMRLLTKPTRRTSRGPLTPRQADVAQLVAQGLTNAQIAHRLHLSERTIENHIYGALTRLGLHSRVQLATWTTSASSATPRQEVLGC